MGIEYLGKVQVRGYIAQSEDILKIVDYRERPWSLSIWGSGGAWLGYITPVGVDANEPLAYMTTDRESPASGDYVNLSTYVSLNKSLVYKAVCSWSCGSSGVSYVRFRFAYYDGSYLHDASVRYQPGSSQWQYLDSDGNYQNIATQPLRTAAERIFTLTVNFKDDRYVSMSNAGEEYDLSAYTIRKASNTTAPHVIFSILVSSDGTNPAHAHVWWFYITEG